MDFLDVPGASGTRYRFRRADPGALPAGAGNVVAVAGKPPSQRFVLCAAARSLGRAAPAITAALHAHPGTRLYLRLNVARATREAEHADIVAGVRPDADLPDLD
jgi:hypothetical protein